MPHLDQDLDMRHETMRRDTGIMLKEKNTLDKSIHNHLCHFLDSTLYALICDTCFPFSDFLSYVWQTLGASTSLQMTRFHFFLWLNNIPLYICTHLLSRGVGKGK